MEKLNSLIWFFIIIIFIMLSFLGLNIFRNDYRYDYMLKKFEHKQKINQEICDLRSSRQHEFVYEIISDMYSDCDGCHSKKLRYDTKVCKKMIKYLTELE